MNCQCEHVDHIDEEPQHQVPATSKAKLIYGAYCLCEDCDANHYDDGDRLAPSEPLERD
jgi:hypothetical protein